MQTLNAVQIAEGRMRIHFASFGMPEYELFLKAKRLPESQTVFHPDDETYSIHAPARFAGMLGVTPPEPDRGELPISDYLFDDQQKIVGMALESRRFACWSGCGLGKTGIGLEFARHVVHRTAGRVLITTINEIVPQWIEEAKKFYGETLSVHRLNSRDEMRVWCKEAGPGIGITNFEKWNPEDLDHQVVSEAKLLAGVVLDESSRLRAGGGVQKWAIIKSCRGIEFKLSLTATPAPNDLMEFASQASFLEKMRSEGEIIWTYFVRDPKTHRWTVKPHARRAFFEFMSSWSIYVQDPKRYGWRLGMPDVPAPTKFVHELTPTAEQRAKLQDLTVDAEGQRAFFQVNDTNAIQRIKLAQLAKGFMYKPGGKRTFDRIPSPKPAFVADLVKQEVDAGLQVIVWTTFDAESQLIAELLKKLGVQHERLTGKDCKAGRVEIVQRFRSGETPVLVTLASMLGWGMNFQNCWSMVFSGFNDSFESMYQAIRRAYRHGQTRSVRIHIPVVKDLEEDMLANLVRKETSHQAAIVEMEENYVRALQAIRGVA